MSLSSSANCSGAEACLTECSRQKPEYPDNPAKQGYCESLLSKVLIDTPACQA